MRRFLIILFLCSSAFGQWQTGVKPMLGRQIDKVHPLGDFVAAWFFNEGSGNKVFDLSGGNTGTFQGTALSWTVGKFGSALNFPGTNEFVACTPAEDMLASKPGWTVSAWVSSTDVTATQGIVGATEGVDDKLLIVAISNTRFSVRAYNESGVASAYLWRPGPILNNNQWYHIVCVWDGTNVFLYQDGISQGTPQSLSGTTPANPRPLQIGGGGGAGGYAGFLIGQIDHVAIWNRALSASEIAELYLRPFAMFVKDDIAILVTAAVPPPAPTGQVITIIMTSIPLFLIPFFFIKRRKLCR